MPRTRTPLAIIVLRPVHGKAYLRAPQEMLTQAADAHARMRVTGGPGAVH